MYGYRWGWGAVLLLLAASARADFVRELKEANADWQQSKRDLARDEANLAAAQARDKPDRQAVIDAAVNVRALHIRDARVLENQRRAWNSRRPRLSRRGECLRSFGDRTRVDRRFAAKSVDRHGAPGRRSH